MCAEASDILWDIVEEHFDEAEFLAEDFERRLDDPLLTLDELRRGTEGRLLASLDALVVAGRPAAETLFGGVLEKPDGESAARITVAAFVLAELGDVESLLRLLTHEARGVRAAAMRGCDLASSSAIEAEAAARLRDSQGAGAAAAIRLLARRGVPVSVLDAALASSDRDLASAALATAWRAQQWQCAPAVERLTALPDAETRELATLALCAWDAPRAADACARGALDRERPSRALMSAYAVLGGSEEHARLLELRSLPSHRLDVLRALGASGDSRSIPVLLEHVASEDPAEAAVAASALSTLAGLDLKDERWFVPPLPRTSEGETDEAADEAEARAALPPFEEDDLDADLVPPPESSLGAVDPEAFRRWWAERAADFAPGERYVGGEPWSEVAALAYLARAPLGQRHGVALALAIRTNGRALVDTRARSREQLQLLRTAGRL